MTDYVPVSDNAEGRTVESVPCNVYLTIIRNAEVGTEEVLAADDEDQEIARTLADNWYQHGYSPLPGLRYRVLALRIEQAG